MSQSVFPREHYEVDSTGFPLLTPEQSARIWANALSDDWPRALSTQLHGPGITRALDKCRYDARDFQQQPSNENEGAFVAGMKRLSWEMWLRVDTPTKAAYIAGKPSKAARERAEAEAEAAALAALDARPEIVVEIAAAEAKAATEPSVESITAQ